jgi:hypothetical protein
MAVPVAVADLQATIRGDRATLECSVPAGPGAVLAKGFHVYRARLAMADCEACPLLFQRIGDLPVDPRTRPIDGQPWRMSWQDSLTPGFRHVYKVSAYGSGDAGVDSNLVGVQP